MPRVQAQLDNEVQSADNASLSLPALTPGARYSSRLSARSALYSELRILLGGSSSPKSAAEYRSMVFHDNVLAKRSSQARAKVWKELRARYILDRDDPLFGMFWKEWVRARSEQEEALTAYVLLALHDRLVTDLGTELLFRLLRSAPREIGTEDVLTFLSRAQSRHPELREWSRSTTRAVAQKYLASIRDFGLATGVTRKRTVRPSLYGSPVRFLLRALRISGEALVDVVRSPIFRLLAVAPDEVIQALQHLNSAGELRFQMQADVIELDLLEDG